MQTPHSDSTGDLQSAILGSKVPSPTKQTSGFIALLATMTLYNNLIRLILVQYKVRYSSMTISGIHHNLYMAHNFAE